MALRTSPKPKPGEESGDGLDRLLGPGQALTPDCLSEAVRLAGRLAALDVFDTLVERIVRPEHVKILACDRLVQRLGLEGADGLDLYARRQRIEDALCRRALAETGEAEFRHAEMAATLHEELLVAGLLPADLDKADFAANALRAEIAAERLVLRAKPGAREALEAARLAGQRVRLVSDFYLPSAALAELLLHVGLAPPLYEALHVSCDAGASKRSGRLYDVLLQQSGCDAAEVTMFGDNPHSDVAMARRRGLRAVLVRDEARTAFYASAAAEATQPGRLRDSVTRLVRAADAPAAHLRNAVPSLLLFNERLYRAARRQGLRHLFFLSREGQLLERLFTAYQDSIGAEGPDRIATHYLLASRRSCYIASLGPLATESFAGLFAQYRRLSVADFCASLGFSAEHTGAIAARLGLDQTVVHEDLPTSDAFRALQADAGFAEIYEARRTSQRQLLHDYLDGFGIDLRRQPLAVVDCGWKGSMQDFLRAALPAEVQVQGFYLGLIGVGQDVSAKFGLLFANIGGLSPDYLVFAENRSLFEVLLCADHGSVIGYERAADGRVVPVMQDDAAERGFVDAVALPVARDAERTFVTLAATRATNVIAQGAWEALVAETHAGLVFRPWLPHLRWLMQARHRESFGVFHLSRLTVDEAPSAITRLRFWRDLLRQPRQVLGSCFWPAATLYAHAGRAAVHAYGLYRRLRGRMVRRRAAAP